jgi:hypothetical protein
MLRGFGASAGADDELVRVYMYTACCHSTSSSNHISSYVSRSQTARLVVVVYKETVSINLPISTIIYAPLYIASLVSIQ